MADEPSRARRLPPIKALLALEAAVRTGSLSAAAVELSVTHSAISQRIKSLEAHYGQALLVRGPRGVEPTSQARLFCDEMRASLDRIALAAEQLAQSGTARILRVNALPSITLRWLIPRLSSFQIANPRIEVRVTTSVERAGDLRDPYDLIIRRSPMSRSGFDCLPFLDDVLGPVAAPAYLKRHPIERPADCLQHPLLHLASRMDAWKRWFAAAGVPVRKVPDGPVFDHFFLSLQAASAQLGIAIGSLAIIGDDLAQGRLERLFPAHVVRGAGFHALYRAPQRRDPALETFVAWLREQGAASLDSQSPRMRPISVR